MAERELHPEKTITRAVVSRDWSRRPNYPVRCLHDYSIIIPSIQAGLLTGAAVHGAPCLVSVIVGGGCERLGESCSFTDVCFFLHVAVISAAVTQVAEESL